LFKRWVALVRTKCLFFLNIFFVKILNRRISRILKVNIIFGSARLDTYVPTTFDFYSDLRNQHENQGGGEHQGSWKC